MKNNRMTYIKNILIPCLLFSVIAGAATGAMIFLFKAVSTRVIALSGEIYAFVRGEPIFLPCLILGAVILGLLAAVLLRRSPNCRGGGIPTSVALLRGLIPFHWLHSIFHLFASTMLTFFCGVPLGNEGPSVQMGTAIGRGTVRILTKKNKAWDRYIMTGGACAGFAAATGAPLSGIFFAFEEAHRRFSPMIFMTASTAVLAGTTVSRWLCELTNTEFPLFGFALDAILPLQYLWAPLAVGVIAGACAILFTKAYRAFGTLVNKTLAGIPFTLKLVLVFVTVAILGFVSADFLGSGHDLIDRLLEGHGLWCLLIVCFCVRGILLMTANHVGVTGGLFVPTLAFGAILGALCGNAMVKMGILPREYYAIMVVIGMVSFLSASSRTPITAVTFGIEALCGLANILPIAVGVTFAFLVIETSGIVAFNDSVIESKVEKEHKGKTATTVDARLTVKPGSFVVGKEVRDILWPPTCVILSVRKAQTTNIQPGISEGDELQIHYQTYDPAGTADILEALVGEQDDDTDTTLSTGDIASVPDL